MVRSISGLTFILITLLMVTACQWSQTSDKAAQNPILTNSKETGQVPSPLSRSTMADRVKKTANSDTVIVRGRIVGSGISRGKTLAAWNGIPTGERYFRLTMDHGDVETRRAQRTVFVRVPKNWQEEKLVGRDVRLGGTWTKPRPIEMNQPRQMPIQPMQMPIQPMQIPGTPSPSTERDPKAATRQQDVKIKPRTRSIGGFVPVPREAVFIAQEVAMMEAKAP